MRLSIGQWPLQITKLLLVTLITFPTIGLVVEGNASASAEKFEAGMNVILRKSDYTDLDELDWKSNALLERLKSINVNSISITWLIYTEGVKSNKLFEGVETPSLEEIGFFIKKAKAAGFIVMLRPIIDEQSIVAEGRNEWRGTIRPKDTASWFQNYSDLIIDYAVLAEANKVDSLIIATELTSMEKYSTYWLEMIHQIKSAYGGYLSYSSNQGVSEFMPWEALDFISVDAFFRLNTSKAGASAEEMIRAMKHEFKKITSAAEEIGLPLVLTEIGSTSQVGAHTRTWVWDHKTGVDLEDQRRFYFASCVVWKQNIMGMYWWAISSNLWLIENPELDKGFSPLNKPAEDEIRTCFEE